MKLPTRFLFVLLSLMLSFCFSPGMSLTAQAATPAASSASIESNTIPTSMEALTTASAQITVKNTGTTTWTRASKYTLKAVGGSDPFSRVTTYALSQADSIAPGQSKTFTLSLKAPARTGRYTSDWRMYKGTTAISPVLKVTVSVVSPRLIGLSISKPAKKLNYFVGDSLDITRLAVVGKYSNGTTKLLTITKSNVVGFDSSKPVQGQTLTIVYGGVSTTYKVNINAVIRRSIYIKKNPNKTVYYRYEDFDMTGLVVYGKYNNGRTLRETVTEANISGFNSDVPAQKQTLTVTIGGLKTTFQVQIKDVALRSIAITSLPAKRSYFAGESLDLTGLKVVGTYTNGQKKVLDVSAQDITGFDSRTPSPAQTLTIHIGGKTATFTVEVKAVALTGIAITSPAAKLNYFVGELLDISGLVVTGSYSNGTTRTEAITAANVTGFNSAQPAANQTLTVTVGGKTATYSVNINAMTLTGIAITSPAAKLNYFVGESLDISGLVVTGSYNNGTTKTEAITAASVTGFNSALPANNQVLTVTVGGKTATYTVNINAVTLTSIAITSPATKLSYFVGDPLNISGLVVTGTFNNGTQLVMPLLPANILGFSSSAPTAGQVLTVSISGKTATYAVDIVAPELKSIAITAPAAKLTYIMGESLDITGLVVTGSYTDGSTKAETVSPANVTGFDSSLPAVDQVLTVTVGAKTATFKVTILERKPAISGIHISSNSAKGSTVAKNGDIITLTFTADEPVTKLGNFKINGSNPDTFTNVGNVYTATHLVDSGDRVTGEPATFQINVKNAAGIYSQTIEATTDGSAVMIVDEKPLISNIHISSNSAKGSTVAKNDDIITLTFTADEPVTKLGNFKINGSNPDTFTNVGNVYTVTHVVDSGDQITGEPATFQINVKNAAGIYSQTVEATTDGSAVMIVDEKPVISNIHISSNSAKGSAVAKNGDIITLTFTADEPVTKLGNFKINGSNPDTFTNVGNVYTATHLVDSGDRVTGEPATFQINVKNAAGIYSQTIEATTDGSAVTIVDQKPVISNIHISSNSAKGSTVAKNGDIITLTFTADEPVIKLGNFKINGSNPDTFTNVGNVYTATHLVDSGDRVTGEPATFQINVKNAAGIYSQTVEATTDGSTVTIVDEKPVISNIHISSNNEDSTKAINGDVITLTFTTDEPVTKLSNFKINGSNPDTFTHVGNVYTATHLVDSGDRITGEPATFQINVKNAAGIYSLTVEATTDGSSVTIVVPKGGVAAEDFGVMNFSDVMGYTVGFGLTDAKASDVSSIKVQVYKGETELASATSDGVLEQYPNATQLSAPFDVFGSFDYAKDESWTYSGWKGANSDIPTGAVVTVTFKNGKVATAEAGAPSGDTGMFTRGGVAAEDFGVMNFSDVMGYTVGFGLTDAKASDVSSIKVQVYKGTSELASATSDGVLEQYPNATQLSAPFDVFGSFDYAKDGSWSYRKWQGANADIPTKAVVTVTFKNGKIATAETGAPTGDTAMFTRGGVTAGDFGVMDLSGVKGYDVGFTLTDAKASDVSTIKVQVYKGTTELASAMSASLLEQYPIATVLSAPIDVFGSFDYAKDACWSYSGWQGANADIPTNALVTVTFKNGKVATAEMGAPTGDTGIFMVAPELSVSDAPDPVVTESAATENASGLVTGFSTAGRTPIHVTLTKGTQDYAHVRVVVTGLNNGIQLIAQDTSGNWYNIVKTGWGPASGFALATATTDVYMVVNTAGSYHATINLIDVADGNKVLATANASVTAMAPVVAPSLSMSGVSDPVVTETAAAENASGLVTGFSTAGRTPIHVTLTKGTQDYAHVRVVVTGLNDSIQLIARDTSGNWYNIVKTGWGPAGGFALATATTDVYMVVNTAGSYHATINLIDVADGNKILATASASVTATAS